MRDFLGWSGPGDDLEPALSDRPSAGKVSLTSRLSSRAASTHDVDPHPLAAPMFVPAASGGHHEDPFAAHEIGIGQVAASARPRAHGADAGHGHGGDAGHAAPATATADQITVRTAAAAIGGGGRARTTVGVGEHVTFTAPGRASGAWTASGGLFVPTTGSTFAWIAPFTAQPVTITFSGTPAATLTMNVIAPDDVEFGMLYDNASRYPAGTAGAGMALQVQLKPYTVSFGGTFFRESGDGGAAAAQAVQGYYTRFSASQLRHAPTARWQDVTDSNFTNTQADQGDTAGTVPNTLPGPWAPGGSYHWDIPYMYRTQDESGDGRRFATVRQTFRIAADGTVTVTKGTESVTRAPGGAAAAPTPAVTPAATPAVTPTTP
ncbi:MAG TPA: hypothetical protein VM261_23540 [Kofleriaceae bacterium]|nr:hypothetical protein [Kofleriaceae bacterium]